MEQSPPVLTGKLDRSEVTRALKDLSRILREIPGMTDRSSIAAAFENLQHLAFDAKQLALNGGQWDGYSDVGNHA